MESMKDIEKVIFQMPTHERAILARNLIRSLENEDDEANVESLWVEEANRRYQELKRGYVKGRPANEVFKDARLRNQ